jgi:4-hydroxyphenylpyruvate dioxygenase
MTAARQIRYLCDTLSLDIIAVGPFTDYEGRLDPSARATKLKELDLWFRVANTLGTRLIQIPCTFMVEGVAGDPAVAASDLRRLADIGATQTPPFRFAYENLCWGTYNDTWEKAWGIIKVVDGDNFGMCLDTFNIAGREWADPASPSGMVDNADQLLAESLRIMVQEVDVQKVFYVQAVDAERLERPLDTLHELQVDGQKPRMGWSRNC